MRLVCSALKLFIITTFICVPLFSIPKAHAAKPVPVQMMEKGGLFLPGDEKGMVISAPLLHTDIDAVVSGPIVSYRMRHTFINSSNAWTEAIYTYPLPTDSAVNSLKMTIGERVIVGKISEKKEAERKYAAAKQAGQRVSLVQQHRPNLFSTSLANIAPGEEITVQIGFSETLNYDAGGFRLRMPLVIGPRYIPGDPVEGYHNSGWSFATDQVPDADQISPPVRSEESGPANPVSLTVDLDAGFEIGSISSPSHNINIDRLDRDTARVSLSESVPANKDFTLIWQASAGHAPQAGLFSEVIDDTRYALLMVTPPLQRMPDAKTTPREVVFVIDTSGSMHGTSIEQAKDALVLALERLQPKDTFRIIRFSSDTSSFWPYALRATPENIEKAKLFVRALKEGGGTEIVAAIENALTKPHPEGVLRQIILITDGAVGNEDALLELIHHHVGAARLFTVGIGSAPNGYLMTRAASEGRGTYTFIESQDEITQQMVALFEKLEHPAMTDISLKWTGNARAVRTWPNPVPDLYRGEPITVLAALPDGTDHVTLTGLANGGFWSTSVNLKGARQRPGIATLWARQKIKGLEAGLRRGQDPEVIKSEIRATALKFSLISRYTSLIALDEQKVRPTNEPIISSKVPTNLPEGWSRQAENAPPQMDQDKAGPIRMFDRNDQFMKQAMRGAASQLSGLPQTATAGPISIALGFIALVLGWFAWRRRMVAHDTSSI